MPASLTCCRSATARAGASALLLSLLSAGSASAEATAGAAAPLQNVLHLSASASVEVTKDVMQVTYAATRDGTDAASVQAALKQALEAGLAEARRAARPQQLEVRTGNFSLYPRYSSKGAISGWQGSAELLVEGRDIPAVAQLAGRIQTMTVQRVGYALSREAREKVEADVGAQAVARFQARAAELARQFGYGSASIREVTVSSDETSPPVPMMRMRAAAAAADEALPAEPGKGTVTALVSGSVQMK